MALIASHIEPRPCPFCGHARDVIVWDAYPRLTAPARDAQEHASAQTPADWHDGEQSDNLQTRTPCSPGD